MLHLTNQIKCDILKITKKICQESIKCDILKITKKICQESFSLKPKSCLKIVPVWKVLLPVSCE